MPFITSLVRSTSARRLLLIASLAFLFQTPSYQFRVDGSTYKTHVSISGTRFLVNGKVTHPGTPAEGLLLNSRMVQAIFDDENPKTVGYWAYPDTSRWDRERNVREFIAALPTYASYGLRAVTVNLQGGRPASGEQVWVVSAFRSDGTLKQEWLDRLDRVIRAADQNGIVVIVGYFYFGQDQVLKNESAVIRAADNITDWLVVQGYTNILIEINNEADHRRYDHAILKADRVHELIQRVRNRSGGQFKVSASLLGKSIPSNTLVAASDYVLLHGNGQNPDGIGAMVDKVRSLSSYKSQPKPIVFNEDSRNLLNMDAAVAKRASWGYYYAGDNDYRTGFQSPPVNWTINTKYKQNFFDRVANFTGGGSSAPAPAEPEPPPSSASDPDSQTVVSFSLINADTNEVIPGFEQIANGATLNLAKLPTRNLNVRANTSPSIVGSVRFALNSSSNFRTETEAPYALAGDNNGDYAAWTPKTGSYTLGGTPFSEASGGGTAGKSLSIGFSVTDSPGTNASPIVVITSPVSGAGFSALASITIEASASDPDGSVKRVEFFQGPAKLGEVTSSPYRFIWQSVPAGSYSLIAKATDDSGAATLSASVSITVGSTAGTGSGLTGQYYGKPNFTDLKVTRTDATVNFDWGTGSPHSQIGSDNFSVRWTGQVEPQYSGTYTFYTVADDGVRLWVNGHLIIDNWKVQRATETSGTITLSAGQRYDIRLEYFEEAGKALARLLWSSSKQSKQVIPQSRLYPASVTVGATSGTGSGLTGHYYGKKNFTDLEVTRTDSEVNFNWGSGSPDSRIGTDYFSVRWTGKVEPRYSETYTFYTVADDGVRLWVNGQLLIDNWKVQAATETSGTIKLSAGQRYDIRLEYFEEAGKAVARLLWSSSRQSKEVIPQNRLYPSQ